MNPEPPSDSEEAIDPRWKWNYQELLRLKARLLAELQARQQEVNASLAESHKDPADTAAEKSERDILIAELGMEKNSIAEIEAALQRIRSGSYGICEATAKPISPDRLRAIPWTRYCKEAAQRTSPRRG
ncbi:MAG: TraR/DksA C4-type zinc finger protein [Opitutaceae bacterium]|jgi:RNA polymerase-binding protein DksA